MLINSIYETLLLIQMNNGASRIKTPSRWCTGTFPTPQNEVQAGSITNFTRPSDEGLGVFARPSKFHVTPATLPISTNETSSPMFLDCSSLAPCHELTATVTFLSHYADVQQRRSEDGTTFQRVQTIPPPSSTRPVI
jgi:hypothetical protein